MAKGILKNLSAQISDSFGYDSTLGKEKAEVSQKCLDDLTWNLSPGEEMTFSELPKKYVESVPFEDVPILFYEAQREFQAGRYAEAISKADSVLLREGRGLENTVRIQALFLKAKCLYALTDYQSSFDILSHIYTNYHQVFSLKKRLEYRFLMGKLCMHLKDYRKAHYLFDHIISIRDDIGAEAFDKIFDISDYLYALLSDADCMINKIGLPDGKIGYAPVSAFLREAKDILHEHPDIPHIHDLEKQLLKLELALKAHIWDQG